MYYWLIAIPVWIICGIVAGYFAKEKGYSSKWYIWGFLFGIFALLAVALIKDKCVEQDIDELGDIVNELVDDKNNNYISDWKCKECGRINSINYKFCPDCGSKNANLKKEKWRCEHCHTFNSNDFNYCVICGSKRDLPKKKSQKSTETMVENEKPIDITGTRYSLSDNTISVEDNTFNIAFINDVRVSENIVSFSFYSKVITISCVDKAEANKLYNKITTIKQK